MYGSACQSSSHLVELTAHFLLTSIFSSFRFSSYLLLDIFHLLNFCFVAFAPAFDDFFFVLSSMCLLFVGWDLLPARKTRVNRTLSFVIEFFAIPMLVAFVLLLAIGGVALIRNSQFFLLCLFVRLFSCGVRSIHCDYCNPLFKPSCHCRVIARAHEKAACILATRTCLSSICRLFFFTPFGAGTPISVPVISTLPFFFCFLDLLCRFRRTVWCNVRQLASVFFDICHEKL